MRAHPALVLNADFQPLSYFPLSLLRWDRAIKAVVEATHYVVE
jgi:5-methylcytosine-specific restriction endonuclease McrA